MRNEFRHEERERQLAAQEAYRLEQVVGQERRERRRLAQELADRGAEELGRIHRHQRPYRNHQGYTYSQHRMSMTANPPAPNPLRRDQRDVSSARNSRSRKYWDESPPRRRRDISPKLVCISACLALNNLKDTC